MKNLKILNFLLLAVLCLGFASCSSDDDDNNSRDGIVGTWVFEWKNEEVEVETNNEEFSKSYKYYKETNCPVLVGGEVLFTKENKCITNLLDYMCTLVGGYTINYVGVIINSDGEFQCRSSETNYTYNNDTLKIINSYGEIKKYTSSVLIKGDSITLIHDMMSEVSLGEIGYIISTNESLSRLDPNDIQIIKLKVICTATRK